MSNNLTSLVEKVEDWAEARNLFVGATPAAQYSKLLEEVGELGQALIEKNHKEIIDGIGDSIVVLIILAGQHGLILEECLGAAYEEIKDRKGKMINGKFVKDENSVS